MSERSLSTFPGNAEVKFYYRSDSQNARSLSDYIKVLVSKIEVNDRSQDHDVRSHRLGDLHVYIKDN